MNTASQPHLQRLLKEFCDLIGHDDPSVFMEGGRLQLGDNFVSLIPDDVQEPRNLFVYLDIGKSTVKDKESTYAALLKINFDLLAGSRGALSLHPETNHLFYGFTYPLDEMANGEFLLESLLGFVQSFDGEAEQPASGNQEANPVAANVKSNSRAQIDRLLGK